MLSLQVVLLLCCSVGATVFAYFLVHLLKRTKIQNWKYIFTSPLYFIEYLTKHVPLPAGNNCVVSLFLSSLRNIASAFETLLSNCLFRGSGIIALYFCSISIRYFAD